jgi:[ribosomal protein S18]-alanine N-acetyltransferase
MGSGTREGASEHVSSSIRVDRAHLGDIDVIAGIEQRSFSDPWSNRSFRDLLEHPRIYFACARAPGPEAQGSVERVVGYVVAWFASGEGEVANLAVAPGERGRGIGAMLLDAALAEGRRLGTKEMFLEVRSTNARARQLYDSRGFIEVGRRKNYYRRPTEDAVILRRTEAAEISKAKADV